MNRPDITLTDDPWRFPEPRILRLENGLEVWHFSLPGQHVAAVELVLPVALSTEPRELEGVGSVALTSIDESTASHPGMPELLDLCGADLHANAHLLASRLGGLVPSRRLPDLLPLLAEILSEPAYAEEDIALHVEAEIAGYKTRLASPGAAARWALRTALYGTAERHGRPVVGSPETLGRIGRDDVLAWHRRHYAPNGATLVIAGEIPELDLRALESWRGEAARAPYVEPRTFAGDVVIADVPGSVQATILIGRRSISRLHPAWPAARLAGHVMAGGFKSRLNFELRERLGYTYGVGGGFAPDVHGSLFQVITSTRTEVAGDAVHRILEALRLAEPITDEELADAKAFRIGVAPLANETSSDIAGQAAILAESGLRTEYFNEHTEQLRRVEADEATDAFRELVGVDDLVIAVAGDAEVLQQQLKDLEPQVIALR